MSNDKKTIKEMRANDMTPESRTVYHCVVYDA